MRTLYVYPTSTFSRRTRLALAHKGLDVELRDARAVPEHEAEARLLSPLGTMPVFVDDGRVLGDSTAIAHYLDLAYPDRPRLFPTGADEARRALAITGAVDLAMNTLVDMGTRYYALRNDPAWKDVLATRMSRAQEAIDSVPSLLGDNGWGAAEIWTISATLWVKNFPARVATAPLVAQIVTLGFRLPDALVQWAARHESREDVRAVFV